MDVSVTSFLPRNLLHFLAQLSGRVKSSRFHPINKQHTTFVRCRTFECFCPEDLDGESCSGKHKNNPNLFAFILTRAATRHERMGRGREIGDKLRVRTRAVAAVVGNDEGGRGELKISIPGIFSPVAATKFEISSFCFWELITDRKGLSHRDIIVLPGEAKRSGGCPNGSRSCIIKWGQRGCQSKEKNGRNIRRNLGWF